MSYRMRVNFKNIACCITILFFLIAGTSAADSDYIIGKEADKHLLTFGIVFVVLSSIILLVSIVMLVVLIKKKVKRSRKVGVIDSKEEEEEDEEERYQSMQDTRADKSSDQHQASPAHSETPKINGSTSGVYQSIDSNGAYQSVEYEEPNGEPKTKQGTPPGTEKGQKDTKENEKQKTLSSFHNPAYEAGVPYGLDKEMEKEVDFKPVTAADDPNENTSL